MSHILFAASRGSERQSKKLVNLDSTAALIPVGHIGMLKRFKMYRQLTVRRAEVISTTPQLSSRKFTHACEEHASDDVRTMELR